MFQVSFDKCPKAQWIPEIITYHFLRKPVSVEFETVDELMAYLEQLDFRATFSGVFVKLDELAYAEISILSIADTAGFAFLYSGEAFLADKTGYLQDIKSTFDCFEQIARQPNLKEKYVESIDGIETLSKRFFKYQGFDVQSYY